MFLFETFFVCFFIFEIELKPATFIDSSVSSRIFLYSEIYDAGLTYIHNNYFFDDNIFRGIIFRKEFSLFSKMAQAKNGSFSVSPWSLTRKMVSQSGLKFLVKNVHKKVLSFVSSRRFGNNPFISRIFQPFGQNQTFTVHLNFWCSVSRHIKIKIKTVQ